MRRSNPSTRLPDAICLSPEREFTQIRNDLLRDPTLSFKAKGILCLLLSNKKGEWVSYQEAIQKLSPEGADSIRSGLKELQAARYLVKIFYVDVHTKRRRGSFWAYTDFPGRFEIERHLITLQEKGLEIQGGKVKPDFPSMGFPELAFPYVENPRLIILKSKKTKLKKINSSMGEEVEDKNYEELIEHKITSSMFDQFWQLYPRKVDKGKTKTRWEQLCNKQKDERPIWREIETAIIKQKQTPRWSDPRFIPHPTTWLNQQRWLDDPAEMLSWDSASKSATTSKSLKSPKRLIFEALRDKDLSQFFYQHCYLPATELLSDNDANSDLVQALLSLYAYIDTAQGAAPAHNRKLLPTPIDLITHYLQWISDNKWITSRSVKLFDSSNTLFRRFCRGEAKKDNFERDPITGESYLRG